ncbi:endonuclease/exonuclease/phosphatase family protein [Solwaraspora sp. WMMB335]|uniref:endonuclease/exonuclease/phosphatase family protein n=1 Tax=Solwaraspora sp. WMMB335 TaxID=3404118 RepID=UPI003B960432
MTLSPSPQPLVDTAGQIQPSAQPQPRTGSTEDLVGSRRRHGRWGRWWRRWLGRVFVTGSALWLVFVFVHLALSGRVWWWLLAGLLPPITFLAVPLLFAAAAAGCWRTRRPAALLCTLALIAGAPLAGINLPGPLRPAQPVPSDALRVVAWNTGYWHPAGAGDDFYHLLRANRADVYLLQEYIAETDGRIVPIDELDRLRRELPGYHVAQVGELVTLSRFPIVGEIALSADGLPPAPDDFTDFWRYQVLRTDLQVGDEVLSVYNAHLPVPLWAGGPGLFTGQFHRSIREQHARRVPQFEALATDVETNDHPVVLAGDLNTTAAMGDIRRLPDGLRDAVTANRSLYPASWPVAQTSLWRLDWALVSPQITVHRHEFSEPAGLSDHRLQSIWVTL